MTNIWGATPNSLYACGTIVYDDGTESSYRGFVLYYNGKMWREIVRATEDSQFLQIRSGQRSIYVQSYSQGDTITISEIRNNSLNKIYTLDMHDEAFASIAAINQKVYIIINNDIYRYINDKLEYQFSVNSPEFGYELYGRHSLDIFVRMQDGIAHYNGTDVQYLYRFPAESQARISGMSVMPEDVFVSVWDPGLEHPNMILHGKLKE